MESLFLELTYLLSTITAPLWKTRIFCLCFPHVSEWYKGSSLVSSNLEKTYGERICRNWICDVSYISILLLFDRVDVRLLLERYFHMMSSFFLVLDQNRRSCSSVHDRSIVVAFVVNIRGRSIWSMTNRQWSYLARIISCSLWKRSENWVRRN